MIFALTVLIRESDLLNTEGLIGLLFFGWCILRTIYGYKCWKCDRMILTPECIEYAEANLWGAATIEMIRWKDIANIGEEKTGDRHWIVVTTISRKTKKLYISHLNGPDKEIINEVNNFYRKYNNI